MSRHLTEILEKKPGIFQPKIIRPHSESLPQNENVVDRQTELLSTGKESAVDNPTAPKIIVDKITTHKDEAKKKVDKSTAPEKVVNHVKRDWSTTDKRRSEHGNEVESYRASKEFKRKIKVYCAEAGIDKQDFYQIVVDHYFDSVVNRIDGNAVDLSTLNNKELIMMWKTKPSIINCYLRMTKKKKWKAHDDRAAFVFNDTDIRIIELGILQTIHNAESLNKIHSFKYCVPEIQEFIDNPLDDKTLDTVLQLNRPKLENLK